MDVSIFEIIGPVMIGPSSSHTAGMARIGRMAREILGEEPCRIELTLHPAIRYTYRGHRTDVALVGGVLGVREDDAGLRDALEIAVTKGIGVTVDFFTDVSLNPNTVLLRMTLPSGYICRVLGVSIGGGSLVVRAVDGVELTLSSDLYHFLAWSSRDIKVELAQVVGDRESVCSEQNGAWLTKVSFERLPKPDLVSRLQSIHGITKSRVIHPVLSYGFIQGRQPLVTTYEQLLGRSNESSKTIAELALDYEANRSGRSPEEVRGQMAAQLQVMREACESGLKDDIHLNFGLTSGKDGKQLAQAFKEGKTLGGSVVPMAIARALGTMEVNGAMGRIVASPTAGSSGIVPGCFITVQESKGLPDAALVDALLVSAMMGVIMAHHEASFSGVVGGCQAEVGVSSAIAAAGLVYLGGGDSTQIVHGMAMAMKNLLGLICDPIAGPVEVPCIKRNAIGVANAFAAADMALAGIRSFIPPDEVIEALVNTQQLLPPELKGTTTGGLACTCTAREVRRQLRK